MREFTVEKLPYGYSDLDPSIDPITVETHYEKHHKGYATKLNIALEGLDSEYNSIEELLMNLDSLPEDIRMTVRNNGGGVYNHNIYWSIMTPGGSELLDGELKSKIENTFGSHLDLKEAFMNSASTLFGSGWTWLVIDGEDLKIVQTVNQDNPIMERPVKVLMGVDIWEHAYYLKYKNLRPDYLEAFWSLINWEEVERRFKN
jgi:Fe-Mn family superoxide dismutase